MKATGIGSDGQVTFGAFMPLVETLALELQKYCGAKCRSYSPLLVAE